jgi:hypothetical protein
MRIASRARSKIMMCSRACWCLLFVPVRLIHPQNCNLPACEKPRAAALGLLNPTVTMNVLKNINGKFNLLGRLALTMAVTLGTLVTFYLVSDSVKAVEDIDLTDDTLAELSQFVAEGHASIRRVMATPGSSADAALVGFEKAVERRIARLRALNELVERRAGAYAWTDPVGGNVDVQRLEQEGRAYLTAGVSAPAGGSESSPMGLHYFDLRAKKLMVTLSAMRDRTEAARAQALGVAEEIVALSSGFGALLIAYLIWYPVLNRRPQAELQ